VQAHYGENIIRLGKCVVPILERSLDGSVSVFFENRERSRSQAGERHQFAALTALHAIALLADSIHVENADHQSQKTHDELVEVLSSAQLIHPIRCIVNRANIERTNPLIILAAMRVLKALLEVGRETRGLNES